MKFKSVCGKFRIVGLFSTLFWIFKKSWEIAPLFFRYHSHNSNDNFSQLEKVAKSLCFAPFWGRSNLFLINTIPLKKTLIFSNNNWDGIKICLLLSQSGKMWRKVVESESHFITFVFTTYSSF